MVVNINLNGEKREIGKSVDLERLLDQFELPKQRVAVELNGTVIRRIEWGVTPVNDGDQIEVVHFVGGG